MGIDARSDAIYELVEEGSAVEQVATGFTFTEGRSGTRSGTTSSSRTCPATRRKYTPGAGAEDVMSPSNKCNGLTYDADLNLLVCEHVTSSLVRERPDGTRETIASHFEARAEQPERRVRPLERGDPLLGPMVRPHARLRRGA